MNPMVNTYQAPPQTRIGHVHLKVSDLDRALEFYHGVLGFEIMERHGDQVAFIAAGDYHHHIGLNTWMSKGAPRADRSSVGLFHTAILYPTRKDLAEILQRLNDKEYPISGASDHGVSEAIYLDDPDGNGVELYRDRDRREWPVNENGQLAMYTRPLDIKSLLNELNAS